MSKAETIGLICIAMAQIKGGKVVEVGETLSVENADEAANYVATGRFAPETDKSAQALAKVAQDKAKGKDKAPA